MSSLCLISIVNRCAPCGLLQRRADQTAATALFTVAARGLTDAFTSLADSAPS